MSVNFLKIFLGIVIGDVIQIVFEVTLLYSLETLYEYGLFPDP